MRTLWCCSYFSFRPRRMEMVSSTVGSLTKTGWKRRASAASFSTCLRYSSSVVAPTQCSSPRASAGFRRFDASIAPSALPAPTSVCISSMKRMTPPAAAVTSASTAFSRSSNSPRYFAPAISAPMSSAISCLSFSDSGTSPLTMRSARPSAMAVLPTPGSPISTGLFLVRRTEHLDGAADLVVAADDRIELAGAGVGGQVARVFLQRVIALLGRSRVGGAALAEIVDRLVERLRRHAGLGQDVGGLGRLLDGERGQQALDRDEAVAGLLGHVLGGRKDLRQRLRHVELAVAAFDAWAAR